MPYDADTAPQAGAVSADLGFDYRIEAGDWPKENELEAIVEAVLDAAQGNAVLRRSVAIREGSEISLLFTDDRHIEAINREFRGQDKPTNVLSFPQNSPDAAIFGPYLGDIVLAFETVFREAEHEKKSFTHHLQHLLVHGFLHLVGYDHETEDEANEMESLEIDILRDLKIENPYKDAIL